MAIYRQWLSEQIFKSNKSATSISTNAGYHGWMASHIKNKRQDPSLDTAIKLAEQLGFSLYAVNNKTREHYRIEADSAT